MRIRLRSLPPLSPLKVWFEIPSTITPEYNTITLLKREICQQLLSSTETIHANQIILELDEFELLDSSTVSLIRENDLLVVKYKPNSETGKKRKRDSVTEESHSLVLRNIPQSTTTPSSSSSSTSSSSKGSSSDSDDSSSDSSTSGASTPPVRLRPLGNTTRLSSSLKAPVYSQPGKEHNVPPGQGKTTTHQRNQRRRKKRMAEKENSQNGAPVADPSLAVMLAQRENLVLPAPTTSRIGEVALQESMLRATKNDNKKRGFKQGMQSATSKHQLFQEGSMQLSSPSKGTPNGTQRLIPPSERIDLPNNIIVTSVDVEAGKWTSTSWQAKVDAKSSGNKPTANGSKNQEASFVPTQRIVDLEPIAPSWDWETVDSSWETYPLLTSRAPITKGSILLWKELALNTATYLPEIMVHAGEIVEVINEDEVKVLLIPRFSEDDKVEMEEDERDVVIRSLKPLEDYKLFV